MAKKIISRVFCLGRSRSSSLAIAVKGSKPQDSISSRLMDENIAFAESIITKWDYDSSECSKSLFSGGCAEATLFLRAVADLRRAMLFYSSPDCHDLPSSRAEILIRAQTLMQSAMRRLEHEFHRILSSNRHHLDPDSLSSSSSSDDEDIRLSSTNAIADLRSIAESMIANGYGLECVRIYKLLRKSIVEEALFCLGFDLRLPCSNIYKLDWRVLDLRIRSRPILSNERDRGDLMESGDDARSPKRDPNGLQSPPNFVDHTSVACLRSHIYKAKNLKLFLI